MVPFHAFCDGKKCCQKVTLTRSGVLILVLYSKSKLLLSKFLVHARLHPFNYFYLGLTFCYYFSSYFMISDVHGIA